MWIKRTINILYFPKTLLTGLVFVLLISVLFCGHIQIGNHSVGAEAVECSSSFFSSNYISTKNDAISLSLLFFSFVVLVLLIKNTVTSQNRFDVFFWPPFIFFRIAQLLSQLRNPILKAFRRGILHPQIYNVVPSMS